MPFNSIVKNTGIGIHAVLQQWLDEHKDMFIGSNIYVAVEPQENKIDVAQTDGGYFLIDFEKLGNEHHFPSYVSMCECPDKALCIKNCDDYIGLPSIVGGIEFRYSIPKNIDVQIPQGSIKLSCIDTIHECHFAFTRIGSNSQFELDLKGSNVDNIHSCYIKHSNTHDYELLIDATGTPFGDKLSAHLDDDRFLDNEFTSIGFNKLTVFLNRHTYIRRSNGYWIK